MRILFLSSANLSDKPFLHDLAYHFDKEGKAILLHDRFGENAGDTRFVTRRISAILSESLVVNANVPGDTRSVFVRGEDAIRLEKSKLDQMFSMVNVVVMNTLFGSADATQFLEAGNILRQLRHAYPDSTMNFFPSNSRSPLGQEKALIQNEADYQKWMSLFEEEKTILDLAHSLSPAYVRNPAGIFEKPA